MEKKWGFGLGSSWICRVGEGLRPWLAAPSRTSPGGRCAVPCGWEDALTHGSCPLSSAGSLCLRDIPLSLCPSVPLLLCSGTAIPPTCKAPASPVPDICATRGVPCQPAAPCRGCIHTMLRGNCKPRDPALGCAPVSSPSLLCSQRRGRSARAGPTQSWKEQSPRSTGCLRSPGSEWLGSGSNSPCISQPSPWHQGQRWPRSPRTFPTKVLPCWGMPGAASPGAAALQARQPPPHPHRLHPAMASWMCWGLPCWGIANGDWPGVPGQGSLALTL